MASTAVVSHRGADRVRAGHPWIYRSDVARTDASPGDLVRVTDERRQLIGWALWSDASQIALRMIAGAGAFDTPGAERQLFADRLRTAIAYRADLSIDSSAYRLVHAEADRMPSLIVDRYADGDEVYLVIQTLSQATDRRSALIVDLLTEALDPRGILARNDPKVRALEGLDERVDVVHGEVPDEIDVREGPVTFRVDLRKSQKTGLFLEQRENHEAARRLARGRGRDGSSYHGGYALSRASSCTSG